MKTLLNITVLCILSFGYNHTNAQSLDSILQLVVENNLELKALQLEYEAELLKIDQVRQIPNPQIGLGIPVSPPETRLGPQVMMVSASQMFPWFGTQKAKEDVVISMSKSKFERISAVRIGLYNKVKVAYYQLIFLEEKQLIIAQIINQYEALSNVSLAKVQSGSASMANVLRIQLKIDEFKMNLMKIDVFKEKFYADINAITQQPWETIIKPIRENGIQELIFDLESTKLKIEKHYPLIVRLDQEIQTSKNRQMVNKKMGAPVFGLGMDYALVNERTDMNPSNNGRDVFVPKLMLSIPIYRRAYKAKDAQEIKNQDVLELNKKDLSARIISQILKSISDYKNALLDMELNEKLIATTKIAYDLLLTDYSTNSKSFDDLLQIQNQLLNYQLATSKAELSAKVAMSTINQYTDY